MANVAVNECYRHTIVCQQSEQLGLNVLYWKCTAIAGSGPTETKAVLDLDALLAPLYADVLSQDAVYVGSFLQKISPLPLRVAVGTNAHAVPGTVASNVIPRQASGFLKKRTQVAGRHGIGRMYLSFPGVSDDDTGGIPTSGYDTRASSVAAWVASAHTVGAGGNTALMEPQLYRASNGTFIPLDSVRFIYKWATQKRRGSFGRPNPLPF